MNNSLSSAAPAASQVPAWFHKLLAQPVESGMVSVDGTDVAYRAWGDRADPTIVLVHGGAAHAHWWDAHAPLLAQHHRVIAVDLSGHGDSGWRPVYNPEQWAREVVAVAEAGGGQERPVVVGHSMGGFVTVLTAARYGRQLAGAIVLDAPVTRPDPESNEGREGRMFRAPKIYPDVTTALEHFHLVPPQPCDNGWLVEHIGRHSLREVNDGWTWKFDPALFSMREGPLVPSDFADDLAHAACRVAIINGAKSAIVDERARRDMSELLGVSPAGTAGVPFVEIPEAHHHLILDQPLAVVSAIRAVLASWTPVGTPPAEVIAD
ncbi:MAG: alpha/beta hydrolase [Nitriliruptoraceae bacterium]